MEFKLGELEELFEKIKNIIDNLEKYKQEDKSFTLYLGNGEQINYSIKRESIPHLLGINTNYLASTGIFREKNSFELLQQLINNPYRIYSEANKGHISYDALFSNYIDKKVDSFLENIKITVSNVEFVCSYKKNRTYHLDLKQLECDYILVKSYDDGRIGVLMFKRNGSFCLPMSNRMYENYESAKIDLKDMLENQVITILNGMKVYNKFTEESKTFNLYNNNKISKIENLQEYSIEFDAYPVTLKEHLRDCNMYEDMYASINHIVSAINEGQPIQERGSKLDSIIRAFNDSLYKSHCTDGDTYTELKNKLEDLKKQLISLSEENNELKSKNQELSKTNEELKSENNDYVKKLTLIKDISDLKNKVKQ